MRNLEQIRALNALKAASLIKPGRSGGSSSAVVKKVPALIVNNGLLATAAFARENKDGIQSVLQAIEEHLREIGLLPAGQKGLLEWLTESEVSSAQLRRVTSESMAYLNYLRRFVKKGPDNG